MNAMIRGIAVISIFALALVSEIAPFRVDSAKNQSDSTSRPVRLEITVTDAAEPRRYVSGLSKDQITVLDEKLPQEIESFEQSDQPMKIGILFDVSRANYLSKENYRDLLAATKEAFLNFVRQSHKDNQYFVLGFAGDTYLVADWVRTAEQVGDGFDQIAAIKGAKKTHLYDALNVGLLKLDEAANQKRAIIVVSDGKDSVSSLSWDRLMETARRSNVLVYAVGVEAFRFTESFNAPLSKLCSISGGRGVYANSEEALFKDVERISVELRSQYTLTFTARKDCRQEWRRLSFKAKPIELKTTPPSTGSRKMSLSVRGREGYYCSR